MAAVDLESVAADRDEPIGDTHVPRTSPRGVNHDPQVRPAARPLHSGVAYNPD